MLMKVIRRSILFVLLCRHFFYSVCEVTVVARIHLIG